MNRRLVGPRTLAIGVLLVSMVPAGLAVPAATASASSAPEGIYVVLTVEDTFADAVIDASVKSADYRKRVANLLPGWLKTIRSGTALGDTSLDGKSTATSDLEEVERIQQWMADPSAPRRPAADPAPATNGGSVGGSGVAPTTTAGSPNAGGRTAQPAAGFVDPNNPNSFQVRGTPGSGRTFWTGANTAIAVDFCTGSCTESDRITARATINPGAVSNKISITTVYSPNAGNLNPFVDLQFKSIVRGTVTGTGLNAQQPGSKTYIHGNGQNLRGNVLTISIALGTDIYPPPYNGKEFWDGAKTADATCSSTDNTCRY